MHFQLHFGSRVKYDPATGQWWPPEDELAAPLDLPVLRRMKICLAQVTAWPPGVDIVQAVAAQCGVLPVKQRIRLQHRTPISRPPTPST